MATETKSDFVGRFGDVKAFGDSFEKAQMLDELRGRMFAAKTDPTTIGRFRVIERLGSGAHGVVFAAEDPRLERRVAIKLLRRERVQGTELGGGAQERLLREAKTLAKLRHRNVVSVHEIGEHDGRVFLAMELVEGQTLAQWIEDGPHAAEAIVTVFLAAGDGLAAAHSAGLVHRDFKPANVLIDADGHVRVADFGLARTAGSDDATQSNIPSDAGGSVEENLTATGVLVGTPVYMAPELLSGAGATALSDQYAFCLALDEAFYGARRFSGRNIAELAANIALGREAEREPASIPRAVRRVINRGLSADPAHRFGSMEELLTELRRERRWPRWLPMGAGGLALAVGVGAWAESRTQTDADPCAGVGAALASTWNSTTRAEMKAAFELAEVVVPAERFEAVSRDVDVFADRWAELAVETCTLEHAEESPLGVVLTRRKTCLEHARAGFEASIDVLLHPSAELLASNEDVLPERRRLELCGTDELLLTALAPPPPPAQREAVRELERSLQKARGALLGDDPDQGLELYLAAAARADEIGYEPSRARAWLGLGITYWRLNDTPKSLEAHREAALAAERGGADLDRAHALRNIARGLAAKHDFEGARRLLDRSAAVMTRAGLSGGVYDAEQWVAEANVLDREGRDDEALLLFRRALGELPDLALDIDVSIDALQGVASALSDLGRGREAMGEYDRLLQLGVRQYGPSSRFVATMHVNLGSLALGMSAHDEAEEHLRRAQEVRALYIAEDDPSMAVLLLLRGALDFERRRYESSAALMKAAVGAAEKDPGQRGIELTARRNLASVLSRLKRYDEAIEMFESVWRARLEEIGPESADAARVEASLGMTLISADRPGEAIERLEHARSVLNEKPDVLATDLHWVLAGLGSALFLTDDLPAARAVLLRAEDIEAVDDVGDDFVCERAFASARVEQAQGEPRERWRGQAERALEACDDADLPDRRERVGAWLREHAPQ